MSRKSKQDMEGLALAGTMGGTAMAFFLMLLL